MQIYIKMKVIVRLWIALLLVPVLFACIGNKGVKNVGNAGNSENIQTNRKLVQPDIPPMLTDPVSITNYRVAHYWDNFDFNDTTLVHEPDIDEREVFSFLYGAQLTSKENAVAAVIAVLKKAEAEETGRMYAFFCGKLRDYLYEPSSMIKNEEFYIPIIEYIISSPKSDQAEKERSEFLLGMMKKNRVGEKASDFEYTLQSGRSGYLHELKSKYTMLFLYDPDCHGCANSIEFVKTAPAIQGALQRNDLKILAFYPDSDRERWAEHLTKVPAEWIIGYDRDGIVKDANMYDMRGTPAIYLLDENKRIILKGVVVAAIEEYFTRVVG